MTPYRLDNLTCVYRKFTDEGELRSWHGHWHSLNLNDKDNLLDGWRAMYGNGYDTELRDDVLEQIELEDNYCCQTPTAHWNLGLDAMIAMLHEHGECHIDIFPAFVYEGGEA